MKILYLIPPSEGKNKTLSKFSDKTNSPPAPLQERGETATSFFLLGDKGRREGRDYSEVEAKQRGETVASSLPLGETEGGLREEGINTESLSFVFLKPQKIALGATQKDLKCTGKRYEEAMEMNRRLCVKPFHQPSPNPSLAGGGEGNTFSQSLSYFDTLSEQKDVKVVAPSPLIGGDREGVCPAISRYSGVMYSAIDYPGMSKTEKEYFDEHFLILSGMYGLIRPQDQIGNYKLPIEAKGLKDFWQSKITQTLNELEVDIIVDLLPGSYKKMIDWKKLKAKVVQVDFYHADTEDSSLLEGETQRGMIDEVNTQKLKKLTHNVKKVKGEYIKKICEEGFTDLKDFGEEKTVVLKIIS